MNTVLIRFDPFFGGYDWRDDVPIVPSTVVIDTGTGSLQREVQITMNESILMFMVYVIMWACLKMEDTQDFGSISQY